MLSMRRLGGFLTGLLLLYALWRVLRGLARRGTTVGRELLALGLGLAGLAAFIATGLLWHRPMAALAGTGPDQVVVDFHSHTQRSHDVAGTAMSDHDVASSLRWHRRAGFDAAFITDHNTVGPLAAGAGLPIGCPGIEVSAWRAHIVLLGDSIPVDRGRYNRDLASLLDLLRSSETEYGALSVASIPEYVRNHWDRLDTLVAAGLDGFEIVNAAPKANEITRAQRDSVIALARRTDRFVVGVSDSHGWGATSMVWNLVEIPGWRESPAGLCAAILRRMGDGFESVRIVERHRLRPDSGWPVILTPLGVLWETWRGIGWGQTLGWLLWIWAIPAARLAAAPARKRLDSSRLLTMESRMLRTRFLGNRPRRARPGRHQRRALPLDGHDGRVDPHPDRDPGTALGARGRDRSRDGLPGQLQGAGDGRARAGRRRRHRLRHLLAGSLRARQRCLPSAEAGSRDDSRHRHPDPVQRLRVRPLGGGRMDPDRAVPADPGGRLGDSVHRTGRRHAAGRNTAVIFADGAGAVVVGPTEEDEPRDSRPRPALGRRARGEALGGRAGLDVPPAGLEGAGRSRKAVPGDGRQGGLPPRGRADARIGARRTRGDRAHDRGRRSSSSRTRPISASPR